MPVLSPAGGYISALQAPIVLTSGALARYPLARKLEFSTRTSKFADFSRQTFPNLAIPLGQWVLALSLLQDSEVSDWISLFKYCQGGYLPFSFVDPWDNLLQYSEQQEQSPWAATNATVAATSLVADPYGQLSGRVRNVNFSMAGDGALVSQEIPILPGGSGNSRSKGITFTFSTYLRAVVGGPTVVSLFLEDLNGLGEYVQVMCSLTPSWQRFSATHSFLPTNSGSGVICGIYDPNGTGLVSVFGTQLETAGKPSGYKQTTSYCGYHPTCYFQTDEFDHTASEFNLNTSQFVIEEANAA